MICKFSVIYICLGLCPVLWMTVRCGELVPSKFSYESQLLEKMIRMEYKMEKMEDRINKTQATVFAALTDLSSMLDNKTTELKEVEDRVDTPMVAFLASRPQDQSLDTSQKVILQTVALNLGGGYDRHLGIFTAPSNGLYQFTTQICTNINKAFQYYIMLDGSYIVGSTKHNTAAYDCASSSVITQMRVGQRVWIQCASGSSSTTQLYETSYLRSYFYGVLLHK